jgi:hypothetical protein
MQRIVVLMVLVTLASSHVLADQDDSVKRAADIILRLCIAKSESIEIRKEGDSLHLNGKGVSVELHKQEYNGLVGGISKDITALSAQQASEARKCTELFLPELVHFILHEQPITYRTQPHNGNFGDNLALKGVSVVYYTKRADAGRVSNALAQAKIPYSIGISSKGQENPSVSIACTSDVPSSAIKELAGILRRGGVSLREIGKIGTPSKRNRLEITSFVFDYDAGLLNSTELTDAQINSI